MRCSLRIQALIILLLVAGCAGESQYMRRSTPPAGPPHDKALVYFMRPSGLGFAIHFQIYDRYDLIGLSQAKSYFAYPCDSGKHLFIGIAENKRAVEADLEAGKSYYIITGVHMGGWKARMSFVPVTRGSEFWDKVEAYKRDLNFVVPVKEEIDKWVAKRETKVQANIAEIISYLGTPEGEKYVSTLSKEDGR
jgi:hypothetical protein